MNLEKLTKGLLIDHHGIYCSNSESQVSYPKDGNSECFLLEDSSYWFKHRNACILELVKKHLSGGQILDVGGGNGCVAKYLVDHGYDVTLLEPGYEGCYNAKVKRYLLNVICSKIEHLNIPPNSLDAISCFDVIEHIPKRSEFYKYCF